MLVLGGISVGWVGFFLLVLGSWFLFTGGRVRLPARAALGVIGQAQPRTVAPPPTQVSDLLALETKPSSFPATLFMELFIHTTLNDY